MVAGGEVRNERNLRNPIQRWSAPRRRRQKPLGGLETMRSASAAPPMLTFVSFPIPGVPLRSTPGYPLAVPPALQPEALA